MSEAFIIKLSDDLNAVSPSMIGGKAFALATLYHRNFSVPKGFVITIHAFNHYLRFLGLDDNLSQIPLKEKFFINRLPEIQQKIMFGNVPPDIAESIGRSLDILAVPLVAVRSSATMEDGEQYSYAGQFESFLNVSKENVLQQVKMCWGSLFSSRAVAYSKKEINGGKMAV